MLKITTKNTRVFEENAMDLISSFISEDKLPREKREELIERRALIASQKAMFLASPVLQTQVLVLKKLKY